MNEVPLTARSALYLVRCCRALIRAVLLSAACALGTGHAQIPSNSPVRQHIELYIQALRTARQLVVDGRILRYSPLLDSVYQARDYAPVWTTREAARAVASAIAGVTDDGLIPDHYHYAVLARTDSVLGHPERQAQLDLIRTDALLRAAYHIRFGRVDHARMLVNHELVRPLWGTDARAAVNALLPPAQFRDRLHLLRPRNLLYDGLVLALARLRTVERQGGWSFVTDGSRLELGSFGFRVAALRQRLVASADLASTETALVFDSAVDAAVRSFQHRHTLTVDGVVGPATLAALNVSVSDRIAQLRVNLERARWIPDDIGDEYVMVNVAGAYVYMIRRGSLQFEARSIVGQAHTRTPMFTAYLRYIELNPTWTVPPSIVGEILSQVRRDPAYLARQGIRVFNRNGIEINPQSIAFHRYTRTSFPYVFRQDPGPLNPLGRIKFVLPNSYNVYLHDTPARTLFEREQRTFSHGCVRVQSPLELATVLLDDPTRWTPATLQQYIDTGETRRLSLAVPVPVLIHYWTAALDAHETLFFYNDVYQRDAPLLHRLNTE